MRILLLNLNQNSADEVSKALAGQGCEIASQAELDVEQIQALNHEDVLTEAIPSELSCCGVITQIKSNEQTKSIRILMVVQGGALERARALDLGADDVISAPFESLEFAAKVRTQFRDRQPELELRSKLKQAEKNEQLAEIAVETLSGGAVTRKGVGVFPGLFVFWGGGVSGAVGAMCRGGCGGAGYFADLPAQPHRHFAIESRSGAIRPRSHTT